VRHMQSRCSTSLRRLRRASPRSASTCSSCSPSPFFSLSTQSNNGSHYRNSHPRHVRNTRQLVRSPHSRADVSQPASFPRPRIATHPRRLPALNTRRRTPSPLPPTRSTRPSTPTASSRCLASSRRSGAHIDPFSPLKFGLADENIFATTQERQAPEQRVSRRSLRRWEGQKLTPKSPAAGNASRRSIMPSITLPSTSAGSPRTARLSLRTPGVSSGFPAFSVDSR
jgi:hypothetical protein